jgi:hypothetical protein
MSTNKPPISPGTPEGGQPLQRNDRPQDGGRAASPLQGEAAQRQKRPRAPQFGTDRRGPRDLDARRPDAARHHGDANGLPRHTDTGAQKPERRKATRDRRQSWS